jgi:hypothetical protein
LIVLSDQLDLLPNDASSLVHFLKCEQKTLVAGNPELGDPAAQGINFADLDVIARSEAAEKEAKTQEAE